MAYTKKDNILLTFEENKKRLRMEGNLILARVMNEALAEMSGQFTEALARGELLKIGGSADEMREFLRVAADRHLRGPSAALKK